MKFTELTLIEPLLTAITTQGYTSPTPIQEQSIPHVLAGRDVLAIAQTGTGKTAAFGLPVLQYIHENKKLVRRNRCRSLILAPTRELAAQIAKNIVDYGKNMRFSHAVVFGGVGQGPQVNAVKNGVDILIATPGRLLDLHNQGYIFFDEVEIFVLDEADRMLDMGFLPDVKKVITQLPQKRQTLFFSATMPGEVDALAKQLLVNPAHVEVTPPATTVERIQQKVYFVDPDDKNDLLLYLLEHEHLTRVLVFTRTKHRADKLAFRLTKKNFRAQSIHGDKSQTARTKALQGFHAGRVHVLVATDIAARGIDVNDISHVINFELPDDPDNYVHRIGRTARAGAEGIAYAFCSAKERELLRAVEKRIGMKIPVAEHNYHSEKAASAKGESRRPNRTRPQQFGKKRTFDRGQRGKPAEGTQRRSFNRGPRDKPEQKRDGKSVGGGYFKRRRPRKEE